jgi:hypothetical protein
LSLGARRKAAYGLAKPFERVAPGAFDGNRSDCRFKQAPIKVRKANKEIKP